MSENEKGKENMTRSEKREEKKLKRLENQEKKRIEKMEDKARIAAEKKKDREEFWKIEDPIGFMRIINITCVILAISALFLSVRYVINLVFLVNYNHEVYQTGGEEFLTKLNIPEGYVPYYNIGNAEYMKANYDNAISNYKSALECHPTEKRECDIRVNLALAMLHKIDFDHLDTEKQKANAIRTLQAARKILCEKGFADPYGTDGTDPDSEQLKQDIDKMLEELGTKPETDQGDKEQKEKSKGGKGNDEQQKTKREQQLQEDLDKQKHDAMEERREADNEKSQTGQTQDENESTGGGTGVDSGDSFNGKTW